MQSDILEIIIPTCNRVNKLEELFLKLLVSPVKDCQITIIDNNSNDETNILCKKLEQKYKNIKYIKNKYNVGLAGNLCKSMELASKKYFWVIFDDTDFNFEKWQEIEDALQKNYDVILTTNYYTKDKNDLAAILMMLIWMPAGIFKKELLNDNVVLTAYTDIYSVHPQLALINSIFNNKKSFYLPQSCISILIPYYEENYTCNRLINFSHFRYNNSLSSCFINGLQSLNNKKIKEECIENLLFRSHNGIGPYDNPKNIRKKVLKGEYDLRSLMDIFCGLTGMQILKFLLKRK